MKPFFLTFLVILLIGCAAAHEALVSKIPGDRREFEIVQVDYSPHRAAAEVTFSCSLGIFAFEMKPDGRKLDRLTLVIKNQHYCEGLSFQDRSGHTTDLLRVDGVQVRPQGSDLVIEIAPPAIDLLRESGRFQYVNQYR